jgi:hypothetical protein
MQTIRTKRKYGVPQFRELHCNASANPYKTEQSIKVGPKMCSPSPAPTIKIALSFGLYVLHGCIPTMLATISLSRVENVSVIARSSASHHSQNLRVHPAMRAKIGTIMAQTQNDKASEMRLTGDLMGAYNHRFLTRLRNKAKQHVVITIYFGRTH